MGKETEVIATLGPAVDDEGALRELFSLGVDIVRLNFSHGSHEEHAERIERVRRVRREMGLPIAIMLDTKGPEIRTGTNEGAAPLHLEAGSTIVLTPRQVEAPAP